ncbi:MAG: M56 family metallopeptidase, partial [Phycisphaerales bacterium]
MNTIINDCLMVSNDIGRNFCNYAGNVFIQSSVLIILLLLVDFMIRKRVRAMFRYWMWMLVFVKLILPPTLSLPTGVGYWCGDYLSADSVLKQTFAVSQEASTATPIVQDVPETSEAPLTQEIAKSIDVAQSQDTPKITEMPAIQPSQGEIGKARPVLPERVVLNPITWQGVAFGFWLVGVLVISVLLIQRIMFVRGLIAQGEAADEDLVEMMNQCRQKVGVRQDIEIRLSNTVMSPAVCGLFRPIVLMPKSLLDTLSPDNLRAVLVHELAHIKRGDLWINCVQTILQIVYFYNPFVWFANAIVRKIREQAVDEMVLVALGAEAKSYSNTLIDIAEIAFFRASLSLRLIGVVESKKELSRRIKHMLNRPVPKSAKIGLWGLFVVMAMGAVLLPMAKAQVGEEMKIASNGVPAAMVGTWFFNNPQGDEEQMAVFPDGRVVVLYSNGHKDRTKYIDGFVELAEYGDARCKMVIREDGTLVQYFTHSEGEKFTKQWKRIDPIPKTNLLRSLTGRDTAKVQSMSTSEPALVFEPIDSQAKTKLLKQIEDMTKGMIEAFNEGNVG